MKMSNKHSTVGTFFLFKEGGTYKNGQCIWEEIDIEVVPSIPDYSNKSPPTGAVSTNLHYGSGNQHKTDQAYIANPEWDVMQTYEIDWTPECITWTLNGWHTR